MRAGVRGLKVLPPHGAWVTEARGGGASVGDNRRIWHLMDPIWPLAF